MECNYLLRTSRGADLCTSHSRCIINCPELPRGKEEKLCVGVSIGRQQKKKSTACSALPTGLNSSWFQLLNYRLGLWVESNYGRAIPPAWWRVTPRERSSESGSFYTSLVLTAHSAHLLFLCAAWNNSAVFPIGRGIQHMAPVETIWNVISLWFWKHGEGSLTDWQIHLEPVGRYHCSLGFQFIIKVCVMMVFGYLNFLFPLLSEHHEAHILKIRQIYFLPCSLQEPNIWKTKHLTLEEN